MPYNQNIENIIEYVKAKLGYPVVSLETELINPNPVTDLMFTGNGVTKFIRYRTSDRPVKIGSVSIRATLYDGSSDVTSVLSDNAGNLVGTGGSGTINYEEGVLEVDFDYPVKDGTQVYINYMVDNRNWIYSRAIEAALLWFSSRRGLRKIKFLQLVPGVDVYEIDTEPVMRISAFYTGAESPVFVWEEFGFPFVFNIDSAVLSYNWVDFYSVMHLLKRLRKYYTTYHRWDFVPDRSIKIYPAPSDVLVAYVDYRVALTEERLPLLQPVEYSLVREYVYAHVLESLGRIRGKYSSFPVVGGETSFGGVDELLEEAKNIYEKVNKELADLSEPLPIVIR